MLIRLIDCMLRNIQRQIFHAYSERELQLDVCRVRVMVVNAIFNNISVISWRSVLLVQETGVPRENHQPTVGYFSFLIW
jgi:hypothetical protein